MLVYTRSGPTTVSEEVNRKCRPNKMVQLSIPLHRRDFGMGASGSIVSKGRHIDTYITPVWRPFSMKCN